MLRILHLEDSKLDAELTSLTLKNSGICCHVTHVESRDEFVQVLKSKGFDLILADYALPDFDGQLALEITHQLSIDVPFIFVSGVLGEEVAIDSMRQGATDYILKHRLERLAPAIKRALAEHQERAIRLRAEQALREAEFRYRLLVESVHEYALFTTDVQGRITLWNRGAQRLFGYSEDAAIGCLADSLLLAGKERLLDANVFIFGEFAEGRTHFERWLIRQDGTLFWAGGNVAPIRTESDQLGGFVLVIRDNTERKQAEEERKALLKKEQVARANAEQRAEELSEVNAALSRSNAQLEQFAYAASHDLQEPLRMVKSFTQMLALRCKDKLDAKAEEMIHFIEFGSERMQNLVDDLLSYSRVLHDRETNRQLVDMNQVLDETLLWFKDQLESSGTVIVREPLPLVMADRERISLVLQNLVSNALKYQGANAPKIKVFSLNYKTEDIIEVQDNGIGFDQQYADRIFGLFKRLHRADEYPGTGVGLALCKQILEQHGGRIWAKAALGEGATFSFALPKVNLP